MGESTGLGEDIRLRGGKGGGEVWGEGEGVDEDICLRKGEGEDVSPNRHSKVSVEFIVQSTSGFFWPKKCGGQSSGSRKIREDFRWQVLTAEIPVRDSMERPKAEGKAYPNEAQRRTRDAVEWIRGWCVPRRILFSGNGEEKLQPSTNVLVIVGSTTLHPGPYQDPALEGQPVSRWGCD